MLTYKRNRKRKMTQAKFDYILANIIVWGTSIMLIAGVVCKAFMAI